jgi:phage/plasmid-like protein (TIGR03299 family)
MPAFAVTDNLDWSVSQRPLYFTGQDGQPVQWEEKVAVVRDDNGRCLGAVSPNYETVQNQDLLKLVQPMIDEGILVIENMGYLSHGARVFAQARINQEFQVLGEDYKAYITLLNGHVGNASVAIGPSAIRVICGNTFSMAYSNLSERYRHVVGVNERVLESKAVLNYVESSMQKYSEYVETLARKNCTQTQFNNALEQIFQKEVSKMRNIEILNQLFYSGTGNGNEGRSFYDAFNAVTDFASNKSRKTAAGRFNYANFGSGAGISRRAMRVLTEMATV